MKVRIVCYEDVNLWILGKFAKKLNENLKLLNIDSEIVNEPDFSADVNHHIIYSDYKGIKSGIDTLMITHVDTYDKLKKLKRNIKFAEMGICMSSETRQWLINSGIEESKLCYVLPSIDFNLPIKKFSIGIFCRVQPDGRKREYFLSKLAKDINPLYFKFLIVGDSWDNQVNILRENGFDVTYYDSFSISDYDKLLDSIDLYLYTGMDEGQIGLVDALSKGIQTIVTNQGFHTDLKEAISYLYTDYSELKSIFLKLQNDKLQIINSLENMTWSKYAEKHLEIWKFLKSNKRVPSKFKDGYNTIFNSNFRLISKKDSLFSLFLKKIRFKLTNSYKFK